MLGYICLVGVSSMSGRTAVGSRLVSRPSKAVGRGAGRSGRAVGLRGFASPDVLKYCLAVFGIPVSNYSDTIVRVDKMVEEIGERRSYAILGRRLASIK